MRCGAIPKIEGVLYAVPYLKKLGVTPENLIYKFDFKGVRFIYLWSGKYDYRSPSLWDADRPKYAEQMKQLQQWMDEAKAKGIRKAFITFHYPVFARSGLGPIPAADNPHKVIASYAKDMEVVVFNGHVHTTEMYDVDGVKYLMLGGGGAEQDPILPGRTTSSCLPTIHRIYIGRVSRQRRSTTTSSWTSNRDRRQSSPSIASDRGRPSRSQPWSCSSESAARFRAGAAHMATALLIIHGLVAVALLGAITHQTLAAWAPAQARPGSFFGRFRAVPPLRTPTPSLFCTRSPRSWAGSSIWTSGGHPARTRARRPLAGPWPVRPQGAFHRDRLGLAARLLGVLAATAARRTQRTRAALTTIFAFIVWWGFLIGHVMNNIRGFGS